MKERPAIGSFKGVNEMPVLAAVAVPHPPLIIPEVGRGEEKRIQHTINAYQQAILAKKSIEQAAENLRLNENYYKAGISTMSDLLEAQTLFQQSKDRYSEAYSTYEIKKTEYLISTGR